MKSDVIVVGAGIIGLAAAARLLAQGAEVTLLERNLIGHESSWAGGGERPAAPAGSSRDEGFDDDIPF